MSSKRPIGGPRLAASRSVPACCSPRPRGDDDGRRVRRHRHDPADELRDQGPERRRRRTDRRATRPTPRAAQRSSRRYTVQAGDRLQDRHPSSTSTLDELRNYNSGRTDFGGLPESRPVARCAIPPGAKFIDPDGRRRPRPSRATTPRRRRPDGERETTSTTLGGPCDPGTYELEAGDYPGRRGRQVRRDASRRSTQPTPRRAGYERLLPSASRSSDPAAVRCDRPPRPFLRRPADPWRDIDASERASEFSRGRASGGSAGGASRRCPAGGGSTGPTAGASRCTRGRRGRAGAGGGPAAGRPVVGRGLVGERGHGGLDAGVEPAGALVLVGRSGAPNTTRVRPGLGRFMPLPKIDPVPSMNTGTTGARCGSAR